MAQTIRVAVAQTSPVQGKGPSLAKIDEFSRKAHAAGARLVLLPEAVLGGYPRGASFGAAVGQRSDEGREEFRRYFEQAVVVGGEECAELGAIAARAELYLVVGVIEREGGTLYCTVLFFSPAGDLMGKHRKLMPTGSERLIWGFGNGSTMPVFDTPIGKLGAVVCWENYMPLARAAHYAKGIEIYCAPTADGRDTWLPTMRHIAIEGRCSCPVMQPVRAAQRLPRRARRGRARRRRGGVTRWQLHRGSVRDGARGSQLRRRGAPDGGSRHGGHRCGKFDFDVTGHYAPPDVFRLLVKTRADAAGGLTGRPSGIPDPTAK